MLYYSLKNLTGSKLCELVIEICVTPLSPRYGHQRAAVRGHTHYCMTSLNLWVNSETEYSGGLRKARPVARHDIGPQSGIRPPSSTHLRLEYVALRNFFGISQMDVPALNHDAV